MLVRAKMPSGRREARRHAVQWPKKWSIEAAGPRTVKHFVKRYSTLVIAQSACLAVGLWLEQSFLLSTTAANNPPAEAGSLPVASGPAASDSQKDAPPAAGEETGEKTPTAAICVMAFAWIAVLQSVVAYLVLMQSQDQTSITRRRAENISLRQHRELLRTRDAVIFGLAKLTESHDAETGYHLERIAIYSTRLAAAIRFDPRYCGQVTAAFVKLIGISSALHDIGKVGVRDAILLKPGKLEQQEWPKMQSHVTIGDKCIRQIESRLGRSSFLTMAREIVLGHHERWDGQGYPNGLCGEEIPLAARIVAIADVYDALSSNRVYREAIPHEKCVQMIREGAGRQFDRTLVEIFLELEREFHEIALSCRDEDESPHGKTAAVATTTDVSAESEDSLDGKLSMIQAVLDQCAADLCDVIVPADEARRSPAETSVLPISR
jgi:putative two-component system response regulator